VTRTGQKRELGKEKSKTINRKANKTVIKLKSPTRTEHGTELGRKTTRLYVRM
jgi:hypothetical protein